MFKIHPDKVGLDGNSPFPFQVHGIQHLLFLFSFGKGVGIFQQPVSQGGLAVIDMGNDTEIPDVLNAHSNAFSKLACQFSVFRLECQFVWQMEGNVSVSLSGRWYWYKIHPCFNL
jgi:hypothetical protein